MHLASGSFELVLESCLDRATEVLFKGLEKNVFGGPSGGWEDPNSALGLTQEPRVRLAGMLPGLARWCHLALEGLPNELIDVRPRCTLGDAVKRPLTDGFLGPRGRAGGGCLLCYHLLQLRRFVSIVRMVSNVLRAPVRVEVPKCARERTSWAGGPSLPMKNERRLPSYPVYPVDFDLSH